MSDPQTVLDLKHPPPGHNYKATIEPQESVPDRTVRLIKDLLLFLAALGSVALIVYLCARSLLSPATSAEEKKWAMSVLSAAAGGLIGYLIRK